MELGLLDRLKILSWSPLSFSTIENPILETFICSSFLGSPDFLLFQQKWTPENTNLRWISHLTLSPFFLTYPERSASKSDILCFKYRRQTNSWESSYRIFRLKTWLFDPSDRGRKSGLVFYFKGNPDFSFISTENQGVSPRASRRGFLCPQKHAPGFFPEPKLCFWIKHRVLW